MAEQEEPLIDAAAVVRELGIPRTTLLRLAREGRIPAVEETKPWHTNRHFRFKLSEVRAALERKQPPPAP